MAAAAQPHDVEADDAAGLPIHEHVRRHVLHDAGMAADHGEPPDAAELVDGHRTRYKCPIFDGHVPAEHGAVRGDAVAAHDNVMAEVTARHHIVVIADHGGGIRFQGPVNGDVLAEHVVVADHDPTNLRGPGHMLRCSADHGMFAELVVASHGDARLDHGSAGHRAEISQLHVRLDGRESPNFHAYAEPGIRTHDGHRVDAHGGPFTGERRG